jgi:hypothetical protein
MYLDLYRYFVRHNHLHLPGIGTIVSQRTAARSNFPNRTIDSPVYSITLEEGGQHTRRFFSWLADSWQVTERDAIVRFNDFVFELRKNLNKGNPVDWKGIGKLSRSLGGNYKLDGYAVMEVNSPVHAEKLIREHAEHLMRVGEEEKTSTQMTEWLSQTGEKKRFWWTWPLMAGILLLMLLGLYFSIFGIDPSSTANRRQLKPAESAATYQNLP